MVLSHGETSPSKRYSVSSAESFAPPAASSTAIKLYRNVMTNPSPGSIPLASIPSPTWNYGGNIAIEHQRMGQGPAATVRRVDIRTVWSRARPSPTLRCAKNGAPSRDQALATTKGRAERWLGRDRLASGVDHARADARILGPRWNRPPVQHAQHPLRLGGVDQDRGHRLRRCNVVLRCTIELLRQLEQGLDRVRRAIESRPIEIPTGGSSWLGSLRFFPDFAGPRGRG